MTAGREEDCKEGKYLVRQESIRKKKKEQQWGIRALIIHRAAELLDGKKSTYSKNRKNNKTLFNKAFNEMT